MAIEDLDLEFEEEGVEKPQTDIIDVGMDLSFSAHESSDKEKTKGAPVKASAPQKVSENKPPQSKPQVGKAGGEVKDIQEARKAKAARSPVEAGLFLENKKRIDELEKEVLALKEGAAPASAKELIAQAKLRYVSEQMANAKLLDKQVTQALQRMLKKAPGLKPEALAIKKLLEEFVKNSNGL